MLEKLLAYHENHLSINWGFQQDSSSAQSSSLTKEWFSSQVTRVMKWKVTLKGLI